MRKKLLSMLLALCLMLTLLPATALADDPDPTPTAAEYDDDAEQGPSATNHGDYLLDTTAETLKIYTAKGAAYWSAHGYSDSSDSVDYYRTYTVTLEADVDVSGFLWSPVTPRDDRAFIGTFDGKGHTISGLAITGDCTVAGVFGFLYKESETLPGIVKNLTVSGEINVSGGDYFYVGGIVGYTTNGTIDHCTNKTTISVTANSECDAGGIVGYSGGTVRNCANTGSVAGNSSYEAYVGGIVGRNRNVVSNCYNTGAIRGTGTIAVVMPEVKGGCAGGICGWEGTITNCYNSGTITGSHKPAASAALRALQQLLLAQHDRRQCFRVFTKCRRLRHLC
jgi:hypothetical protein